LGLGHDLHAAELAASGYFRRDKQGLRAAALALHFECVRGELAHLLGPHVQMFIKRPFLNLRRALRDCFLVTTVRARQKPILRLEQQIRSASWTRKLIDRPPGRCVDSLHFVYSLPRVMPNMRSKNAAVALLTLTRFACRMK